MSRVSGLIPRLRLVTAGAILATGLAVPMAMSAPASAHSTTPFCNAVFSYAKHNKSAPSPTNLGSFRAWAKAILPYYEKMEATAPDKKTKEVLAVVVAIIKNFANMKSLLALEEYFAGHAKQYTVDVQSLAKDISACA